MLITQELPVHTTILEGSLSNIYIIYIYYTIIIIIIIIITIKELLLSYTASAWT
jgi:hypothetical protein